MNQNKYLKNCFVLKKNVILKINLSLFSQKIKSLGNNYI